MQDIFISSRLSPSDPTAATAPGVGASFWGWEVPSEEQRICPRGKAWQEGITGPAICCLSPLPVLLAPSCRQGAIWGQQGLALGRDLRLLLELHLEGRRLGWSPGCPRDQPHSSSSPRLLFFCPFGVFFSGCACSLRVTILHLSVLKADGDRPRCRCHHHLQPSAGKIKMQNEIKMHNLAGPKGRQVEGHGGVRAI